MKRRTFLINSGLTTSGLILDPWLIEKVMNFIEKRGEPLLEFSNEPENILYAHKYNNAGKFYFTLDMDCDTGYPKDEFRLIEKSEDQMRKEFYEEYDWTTFRSFGESDPSFNVHFCNVCDTFTHYYFPEHKCYPHAPDFNSLEWNKLSEEEKSEYTVYLDDPIPEEDKEHLFEVALDQRFDGDDLDFGYEAVITSEYATDFFWRFQNKYKKLDKTNKYDVFAFLSTEQLEYEPQEVGPAPVLGRTFCDGLQSISILQHELNRLNWNTKIEMA